MGRNTKKCTKKCTKHTFSLKPVHYSAFFSHQISGSFCSLSEHFSNSAPIFNHDKRHYTRSFILSEDRAKLQTNIEFYRQEHSRAKAENDEQKSEMFQPKPKPKYAFCNVCKVDYDDYLDHINSLKHKTIIKNNVIEANISELCQLIGHQPFQSNNGEFQKQRNQHQPTTNFQHQSFQKSPINSIIPDLALQDRKKSDFEFCFNRSFYAYSEQSDKNKQNCKGNWAYEPSPEQKIKKQVPIIINPIYLVEFRQ